MFRRNHGSTKNDFLADRADQLMREGLRSLPSPVPSADFDRRVLEGLQQPVPWIIALRHSLKPMLTGMTGSFLIGLLALHLAMQQPTIDFTAHAGAPFSYEAMQKIIDSPNLSILLWWRYSQLPAPPPGPPTRIEEPALNHSEIPPSHNQATV